MAPGLIGCPVVVTGRAGFLGQAVLKRLAARGIRRVVGPRWQDYDLLHEEEGIRMGNELKPACDAQPACLGLAKLSVEGQMVSDVPLLVITAADEGQPLLSILLPSVFMVHQV